MVTEAPKAPTKLPTRGLKGSVAELVKDYNAKGVIAVMTTTGKQRRLTGLTAYQYMRRHADELGIPSSLFGGTLSGEREATRGHEDRRHMNQDATIANFRSANEGLARLTPEAAQRARDQARDVHRAAVAAKKPEAEVKALYADYWLQQHRFNLAKAQAAGDAVKVEKITKLLANIWKKTQS